MGQVHGLSVGTETAGTFIEAGVQFRVDGLRLAPLALFVLLCIEDVRVLGSCDAAQFVALGLVTGRCEIYLAVVVACQHWREVGTPRVEIVLALDAVFRTFLLPDGSLPCGFYALLGQWQEGAVRPAQRVNGGGEALFGSLVVAVLHLL